METIRRHVLVLGQTDSPPWEDLARWLDAHGQLNVERDRDLANFDLVLLCASRPYQYSPAEIDQLRQKNPFATLIQIFGPWCYGEVRTGPLPEGILRMAWFEWPYRLPQLLADHVLLPETASPQEAVLASLQNLVPSETEATLGIWADTADDYDYLRSAGHAIGFDSIWIDHDESSMPKALIGLIPGTDGTEFTAMAAAFSRMDDLPKLVCLGTPSWDDWMKCQEIGVSALLGQPFRLADLVWLLDSGPECGILPLVNPLGSR